jgi:DNA-binding Xre family transcriptional regulator
MLKISYKKLWKLLIELEIDKKTLGAMANISASTLTKMMKSESVNLDILLRICVTLKPVGVTYTTMPNGINTCGSLMIWGLPNF